MDGAVTQTLKQSSTKLFVQFVEELNRIRFSNSIVYSYRWMDYPCDRHRPTDIQIDSHVSNCRVGSTTFN